MLLSESQGPSREDARRTKEREKSEGRRKMRRNRPVYLSADNQRFASPFICSVYLFFRRPRQRRRMNFARVSPCLSLFYRAKSRTLALAPVVFTFITRGGRENFSVRRALFLRIVARRVHVFIAGAFCRFSKHSAPGERN